MMIALLALLLQSGHVFQPADPAWKVIEDTLERGSDSFVVVTPKERRRPDPWREKRYSEDGRERKILRYDPQGRLRMEADLREGEQFTRILRADGSLAACHHHQNSRMIEAFSISRDGKTVHHVQDGIGQLVTEGEDGASSHLRLLPGIQVGKDFRGDRCVRISIWIGNDHYVRTPDGEDLSLYEDAEWWTVRGADAHYQGTGLEIVDGKVRPRDVPPKQDIRSAAAWPKRRAAFVARVEDALNAAEEDWARLGLDFIRDESPWPH